MQNLHKKAYRRLYSVAAKQQGFFTAKQAIAAGFTEKTHPYHVNVGNWIREHRGVYRLAQFPAAERPDLTRWSLWSRNRQEIAEGVYSYETALSLHDLSDVMPAKLHMTVPKSFRRNSKIPSILVLHRANLSSHDIETVQGVQATKPLRTVIDMLQEKRISKDILIQAVREGLRRGLIPVAAIKQVSLPKEQHQELQDLLKRANQ